MRTFRSAASRGRQSQPVFAIGVISVALTGVVSYVPAHVQQPADDEVIEEISITGTRAKNQSTVNIKRNSTTIVDRLSAADIGDLPFFD